MDRPCRSAVPLSVEAWQQHARLQRWPLRAGRARNGRARAVSMTATPPVVMQGPQVTGQQAPRVPWRRAIVERSNILPSEQGSLLAAYQPIERTVEGTGFLYKIRLRLVGTTAANAATVVFADDAP